jgi:prepilin-type N-terminal cleavage/methylation domain-containing protein
MTHAKSSARGPRAFTLVELLVAISIIAILITLLLPSLYGSRRRARYACWLAMRQSNRSDPRVLAYYTFEEASGRVVRNRAVGNRDAPNYSQERLDGQVLGGGAWTRGRFGPFGAKTALELDGASGYVDLGSTPQLAPKQFTLEVWTYLYRHANSGLVSRGRANAPVSGYQLSMRRDGTARFSVSDGKGQRGQAKGTTRTRTREWLHLAATYDGKTMELYVNGKLDAASPYAKGLGDLSAHPTTLGNLYRGGWRGWTQGILDEVVIFGEALGGEELKQRYVACAP